MINTPPSVSDDCTPTPESTILADDWSMTENTANEETAPFDGKIIARMPDLGSNGFANNIERQKYPSVWKNVCHSMMSTDNRQLFFKRMTAFGGAVLLCGVGILFLEQSDNEPENNGHEVSKMLSEQSVVPSSETVPFAKNESKHSPNTHPEGSFISANTGNIIPVADITAVQRSVDQSSPKPDSPWDRPAGNAYSPWNVTQKQKENSPAPPVRATPPTPVIVENSPVPPAVVPPAETVEMTPMTPLSMPVSPYEQQLFVAQAAPPARPPVDPFIQSNVPSANVPSGNTLVPGMVQTHERINNPVNMVPPNNVVPSTPQPQYQQQYQQPAVLQGRQPMNTPPQGYTGGQHTQSQHGQSQHGQSQHGQYGQYNPYAGAQPMGAASNVPVTNAPPQNMPIPSGVSTLSPQEGYYSQPSGNVPAQNNNFHPNVTPAYRRVY